MGNLRIVAALSTILVCLPVVAASASDPLPYGPQEGPCSRDFGERTHRGLLIKTTGEKIEIIPQGSHETLLRMDWKTRTITAMTKQGQIAMRVQDFLSVWPICSLSPRIDLRQYAHGTVTFSADRPVRVDTPVPFGFEMSTQRTPAKRFVTIDSVIIKEGQTSATAHVIAVASGAPGPIAERDPLGFHSAILGVSNATIKTPPQLESDSQR